MICIAKDHQYAQNNTNIGPGDKQEYRLAGQTESQEQ